MNPSTTPLNNHYSALSDDPDDDDDEHKSPPAGPPNRRPQPPQSNTLPDLSSVASDLSQGVDPLFVQTSLLRQLSRLAKPTVAQLTTLLLGLQLVHDHLSRTLLPQSSSLKMEMGHLKMRIAGKYLRGCDREEDIVDNCKVILENSYYTSAGQYLRDALILNDESIARALQEEDDMKYPDNACKIGDFILSFIQQIEKDIKYLNDLVESLENKLTRSSQERDTVKEKLGEDRWKQGPRTRDTICTYAQKRENWRDGIRMLSQLKADEMETSEIMLKRLKNPGDGDEEGKQ